MKDPSPSLMRQISSKETSVMKRSKDPLPKTLQALHHCGLLSTRCPPGHLIRAPSRASASRGLRLGWEILGHFPNPELEEISPIAATRMAPPKTDNGAPEESNVAVFLILFNIIYL